jgi:tetratricopeptide (TPR) repeat protein
MPQRRWPLFLLLAASLLTQPAFSQSQPAPPAGTASIEDIFERGRLALIDDKYDEAARAFDEVLQMRDFSELEAALQIQVLHLAAMACHGRKDYLGAHEFISLATAFPEAHAEQWLARAYFAGLVEAWADAAVAYTTIAKRWPKSLPEGGGQLIALSAIRMNQDGRHATERLDLLNALFAANFKLDWGIEPANLWRDLALDALEHKDLERARELAKRITDTGTLVEMRIDRRFDALTRDKPRLFDVYAAADREHKRLRSVSAANPTFLAPVVQQTYAMFATGRFDALIELADSVLARVAKAPADSPPYVDSDEKLNWIYDNKYRALRALGRWDEALAVLEAGRGKSEGGGQNVSQAINLGNYLLELDRPAQALQVLEGIDWARSLSPYGRMQLQYVRYRAYAQLGNPGEAEKILAYIREHKDDAGDTWQTTALDSGDIDGAAALLISRLRDPEQRTAALLSVQIFKPIKAPPGGAADEKRWQALVARPDVAAVIDEVGRRETFPTYAIGF